MRVFGIDCGTEFTGYGVVELDDQAPTAQLRHIAGGTVRVNRKQTTAERLAQIYAELVVQLERYAPDAVAIEDVFFSANARSALKLGQVRGVALLAAANCGRPVAEYAPLSVKSAVVGYGLAAKDQVQFMVMRLLALTQAPDSPDAAATPSPSPSAICTPPKPSAKPPEPPVDASALVRPPALWTHHRLRLGPATPRPPPSPSTSSAPDSPCPSSPSPSIPTEAPPTPRNTPQSPSSPPATAA